MAGDIADGVKDEEPALVDRFSDGMSGPGSSRDYSPGLHGLVDSGVAG